MTGVANLLPTNHSSFPSSLFPLLVPGSQVCVDAVCNTRLPLPDLGFGSEPQRVSDPALGSFSVEAVEDVSIRGDTESLSLKQEDDEQSRACVFFFLPCV